MGRLVGLGQSRLPEHELGPVKSGQPLDRALVAAQEVIEIFEHDLDMSIRIVAQCEVDVRHCKHVVQAISIRQEQQLRMIRRAHLRFPLHFFFGRGYYPLFATSPA